MSKPLSTFHRLMACALIVFALAPMIVGCDGGGEKPGVTIRFWNGFTGPDGRTMLQIVKRFNAENPGTRVIMQRMEWATYYNKLFVAGLGDRAPEVFVVHMAAMERFIQAGFVSPVDDLIAGPADFDTADIDANVWAAVAREDRHFGLPLDVHPIGMYYNKKLLREAGVVDEDGEARPPRSLDEFLDAARRVTALPPGPAGPNWGYVFSWFRTNFFTFVQQFNGQLFTPDYSTCTLTDPGNAAALRFAADLIHKHRVAPSPDNFDSWIGFRQGRVGIVFEGIYMLSDLKKQTDLEWGAAPLPVLGERPAAWADSHVLCLRQDLTEEEREAAWRFMKFLSDNSLDWAEGGQVPVRRSLRDTERFRAMTAQAAFAEQMPHIEFFPRVPFIFEFQGEFDIVIEKVLRGSAEPEPALAAAERNVNEIIARRRAMLAAAGR